VAKRRTRKQKEQALHRFTFNFSPAAENEAKQPRVKGQFKKSALGLSKSGTRLKSADILAKETNFELIRKDILKSLILASFVLALEVVVYLAWY
jgi:hypothetical protein